MPLPHCGGRMGKDIHTHGIFVLTPETLASFLRNFCVHANKVNNNGTNISQMQSRETTSASISLGSDNWLGFMVNRLVVVSIKAILSCLLPSRKRPRSSPDLFPTLYLSPTA